MKTINARTLASKALCAVLAVAMAVFMLPVQSLAVAKTSSPTITIKGASTGKVTLKLGSTYRLRAKASKGKLVYTSTKPGVVSVSKKGTLKARKTGSATVTVKIKGKSAKKKIAVKVVKASKYKSVKSFKLYLNTSKKYYKSTVYKKSRCKAVGSTLSVAKGSCMALCAKFNPTKASNKNLIYTSSNTKVATVSAKGILKAVSVGTAKITVRSAVKVKVKKTFKVTVYKSSNATVASLNADKTFAYGANDAAISITSDKPLNDDIPASNVVLSGLLEGYTVTAIGVTNDDDSYVMDLGLEWEKSGAKPALTSDDNFGYVTLEPGCFQDSSVSGVCAVGVVEPEPYIVADEDITEYDSATETLTLILNLDSLEATDALCAESISLPADTGNTIQILDAYLPYRSTTQIAVDFSLTGNEMGATFDALDDFITEGGIAIDGSALNSGKDATVISCEVKAGEEYGYSTTALDFLRPSLIADVNNVSWSIGAGGYAVAKLNIDLGNYSYFADIDFMSVDTFPKAVAMYTTFEHDNSVESNSNVMFGFEPATETGKTSFKINFTLNEKYAEAYGAFDEEGNLDEEVCNDLLDYAMNFYYVGFRGGVVKNELGVAQSDTMAFLFYDEDLDDEDDDAGMHTSSLKTASLKALADDEDDEDDDEGEIDWDEVRSAAGELLEAAGALAWGLLDEDPEKLAYITSGLGGLIGFDTDDGPSTQDIMDKLESMDVKLTAVDKNVNKIESRLNEIESRESYRNDVKTLQKYLSYAEMYTTPVSNGIAAFKKDATAGSSTPNEKQYADAAELAETTKAIGSISAGMEAYAVTLDLGSMLAEDSTLSSKSIVEEYADYVGTYYNWQPETCDYVSMFHARLELAYQCAYQAAYNELAVEYRDLKNSGKSTTAVDVKIKNLETNVQKVVTTMEGKMAKDKNGDYVVTAESDVHKLTYVDTKASTITSTITGKKYDKNNFNSATFFGSNNASSARSFLKADAEDISNPSGESSFNRSNWETMIERLEHTSYKCLKDEMKAVGFTLNSYNSIKAFQDNDGNGGIKRKVTDYSAWYLTPDLDNWMLIGEATRTDVDCHWSKSYRIYSWSGPCVNLATNQISDSKCVLNARDEFYTNSWPWKWHWGSTYNLYIKWVPAK